MDVPSVKHHLTTAKAVLFSGVVQGHTWLRLLPPKGCMVLSRLDHTTQGLIPHTKVSSHAATPALSAGYVWLKLLFLFLANSKN